MKLDSPKVELQTVVKYRVLGTELESSTRAVSAFNSSIPLQLHELIFFFLKGQRVFIDSFSREDMEMSLEQRCSASMAT